MSEINTLTVNGKQYDLADAAARQQLDMVARNVQPIVPIVTLNDYLANKNKFIDLVGAVYETPSNLSISDRFFCYEGDTITGTLSNEPGKLIFVTYDKDGNPVTSIQGAGWSSYTEFAHTFTAEECTFRIGGVVTKTAYYALSYTPKNNLFVCAANENDKWEV